MDDVIHLSDNCGASGYFYSGSLLTSLFSINVNVFRSPLLFLSKGASLEGMAGGGEVFSFVTLGVQSLYVSGKLPTYPCPKPTFCPK